MRIYVKKPIKIKAVQYNGNNEQEIKEFVGDNLTTDMCIKTLEGNMKLSINDYVIRGVKGEYYPCKPDIFEETYNELTEQQETKEHKLLNLLKEKEVHIGLLQCYINQKDTVEEARRFYNYQKEGFESYQRLSQEEMQMITDWLKEE